MSRHLFLPLALLAALPLPGQVTPTPNPVNPVPGRPLALFPQALQKYLDLTNAQVETILRFNLELDAFVVRKQLRARVVQAELSRLMNEQNLDPMAIGLRHVELETIRREIGDEAEKTRGRIVALLNDPQKARLKTLDDASRLDELIRMAESERMLPSRPVLSGIPAATPLDDSPSGQAKP